MNGSTARGASSSTPTGPAPEAPRPRAVTRLRRVLRNPPLGRWPMTKCHVSGRQANQLPVFRRSPRRRNTTRGRLGGSRDHALPGWRPQLRNHSCKTAFNSRKAGSRHRDRDTRSAISRYRDALRGVRVCLRVARKASLGRMGLTLSSRTQFSFDNQTRSGIGWFLHPRTRSTSGESLHTHVSSSGSTTMALARWFHEERARFVLSISCNSWRSVPSLPLPSWSKISRP